MSSIAWKSKPPLFFAYKKKKQAKMIQTAQFIYQIGDSPNLRRPSKPVPIAAIKTSDFQKKTTYLKKCMLQYRKITGFGRGITAVQVGIPERFSVIYMPERKEELLVIINPQVLDVSKKRLLYPEMCMSANPLIAEVARPSWISFFYYDEHGEKQIWNTKDIDRKEKMYNRVFQHEIDHMDGIINIDKVLSKNLFFESDPAFYEKATFKQA